MSKVVRGGAKKVFKETARRRRANNGARGFVMAFKVFTTFEEAGNRMYCATCGAALAQGVSYCNRCGARSGADARDSGDRPRPETVVSAIVTVFVSGIGAIIGLLAVMKHFGLNDGLINGFVLMVFLLMLALEAVFVWQLAGRKRAAEARAEAAAPKEQTTQELEGVNARALTDAPPSVTEHATRTFEPAYRERGPK